MPQLNLPAIAVVSGLSATLLAIGVLAAFGPFWFGLTCIVLSLLGAALVVFVLLSER